MVGLRDLALIGVMTHAFARIGALVAMRVEGIVNLATRGMLVVSVARRFGSEGPFARLLCCPALTEWGRKKGALVPLS